MKTPKKKKKPTWPIISIPTSPSGHSFWIIFYLTLMVYITQETSFPLSKIIQNNKAIVTFIVFKVMSFGQCLLQQLWWRYVKKFMEKEMKRQI